MPRQPCLHSPLRIFLDTYILFEAYYDMLETLKALAEPNRLHIVELLRDGPRPVGDMVQRLHLRQPQVSKHLRVLSDAGLVDARVDAQRRIYTLRKRRCSNSTFGWRGIASSGSRISSAWMPCSMK